ncbi:hypothetical protein DYB28_010941 [Aphanomyces astaci]|uniref:Uncharacterized protein n=1 Tax=Aphanomyces astaci TaxID=112090 RepID=A0A9X8EEV9_APHAT|nr:hypothetical protein DYB28_010941 [Aphanomyces astaci]
MDNDFDVRNRNEAVCWGERRRGQVDVRHFRGRNRRSHDEIKVRRTLEGFLGAFELEVETHDREEDCIAQVKPIASEDDDVVVNGPVLYGAGND